MPQRRPLILHVGMHKTGTTAIQASLAANRAWLRDQGVCYPELVPGMPGPRTAHHAVAHGLAAPTLRRRMQLLRFRRRIERSARGADLTVISAEPIYRHRLGPEPADTASFMRAHRAYLARLARYFRGFAPTVLLYLRRPDAYLVSRYKEAVTMGVGTPDFEDFMTVRPWLVAFPERIAAFRDVFGALEIRTYETERAEGLLARFYAGLGLPEPPGDPAMRVRVSPSNRATLWLRRAQRETPRGRREHSFRVIFATSPAGASLFHEQVASTLWPSVEALNEFAERHRSAYDAGGFTVPDLAGIPRTVWSDEMHGQAERAFADWERANRKALADRGRRGPSRHQAG